MKENRIMILENTPRSLVEASTNVLTSLTRQIQMSALSYKKE